MIQQLHSWVGAQKNWKQHLEMVFIPPFHSSMIHNSQKMATTQVSTGGWMDKQSVVHPYSGMLFSLKEERDSDTGYSVDESWGHYADWSKPVTKGQMPYDSTYVRYPEYSNP